MSAAATCSQATRQEGRCTRRRINPRAMTWRLLALHRSIRPLLTLCARHAERRVVLSMQPPDETHLRGRRRELYDFLRSQPPDLWVSVAEVALGVYGCAGFHELAAVRNLIHRIRKEDPKMIETLPGVGYRLRAKYMTREDEGKQQHARAS